MTQFSVFNQKHIATSEERHSFVMQSTVILYRATKKLNARTLILSIGLLVMIQLFLIVNFFTSDRCFLFGSFRRQLKTFFFCFQIRQAINKDRSNV